MTGEKETAGDIRERGRKRAEGKPREARETGKREGRRREVFFFGGRGGQGERERDNSVRVKSQENRKREQNQREKCMIIAWQ